MTDTVVPALDLPGQAAAHSGPLDLNMNFLFHHAFRRDLGRLAWSLQDLAEGDTERAARLARHVHTIMAVLHVHHTGEDTSIWPVVRNRRPDLADVMDAMEAEHAGLAVDVVATMAALDALARTADEPHREAALETVRRLTDNLEGHLDHEEMAAVPILQDTLGTADWAEISGRLRTSTPRSMLRFITPWLLDDLPEDALRQVRADAPRPMVVLWRLRWRKEYEAYAEGVWG